MTASIRYKFIKNSTNAGLSVNNFPSTSDGDDKQPKFLKHILVAGDFGGGVGQIDHVDGLILDVIPRGYNIIWFEVNPFRPDSVTFAGRTIYNNMQNQAFGDDVVELVFWKGSDNTLRVYDKGKDGAGKLAVDDLLTATIILGPANDYRDVM